MTARAAIGSVRRDATSNGPPAIKFGLFYELQLPRPLDNDQWDPDDESARALVRAGRRGGFMGSSDFIRENLKAYEEANLDAIIFIVQCGDRKHEDIMDSLNLFAKEVMPEFQERHETKHREWREEQLAGVDLLNNSTI